MTKYEFYDKARREYEHELRMAGELVGYIEWVLADNAGDTERRVDAVASLARNLLTYYDRMEQLRHDMSIIDDYCKED